MEEYQQEQSPIQGIIRAAITIGAIFFVLRMIGGRGKGVKRKAVITTSSLRGVDLEGIKLQGAKIASSSFRQSNLSYADLSESTLRAVDLRGATLREADLEGTEFNNVRFNKKTTLPDGSFWAKDVDLARFTDPDHADFWRSTDPESPAYEAS